MKRIGLTGNIATGKSTITAFLREKGYFVIDADLVARDLEKPGSFIAKEIQKTFGEACFDAQGHLQRATLGKLIFSNNAAREKLNAIMFPAIWSEIENQLLTYSKTHPHDELVFVDAAVLIESGGLSRVDECWVVYCSDDIRLERLMVRNGLSKEDALVRMRAQMDQDQKKKLAKFVIDNSGTWDHTRKCVEKILETYL